MNCPNYRKEVPAGREVCPGCYHPVKEIPVPPGGESRSHCGAVALEIPNMTANDSGKSKNASKKNTII